MHINRLLKSTALFLCTALITIGCSGASSTAPSSDAGSAQNEAASQSPEKSSSEIAIPAAVAKNNGTQSSPDILQTESEPDAASNPVKDPAQTKIALICENPENSGFSQPCIDRARELSQEKGFTFDLFDCKSPLDWQDYYDKTTQEEYDLIIGLGWSAADYAHIKASRNEGTSTYALIDANGFSEDISSIDYDSLQASYIIGVMAATAFPGETKFGCITAFGSAYCDAFFEGVESVTPGADMVLEAIYSYSDPQKVHDTAIDMAKQGIKFIYFTAGAGFPGIYDASLELAQKGTPIYTVSQDTDETGADNPYILAAQIKRTDVAVETIITDYLAGELKMGNTQESLGGGSIEVSNITVEGNYRNQEIITDDVVVQCLNAANGLIDGSIVLNTDPDEQNEVIN